jgi:hypothetical protein
MDSKEALEQLDDSGWKHIPNVADVDVRSYLCHFHLPYLPPSSSSSSNDPVM